MLQQLHAASKSWVAGIVMGFLVLAFALWGVADIFHAGADTVVAEIGKTSISSADYNRDLKDQMRALSEQAQTQITMDQAKAIGLDRSVLDTEISKAAIDEEDHALGLTVSRATIASQIQNDHNFFGAGGAFDPGVFQRFLQDEGFSEAAYVSRAGDDVAREQLINAIADGLSAPAGLTRLLFDFTSEQRTAEYLVVTPDEAGPVPEPSDADLETYHKAHAAEFSSPEYRAFDYIEIGPSEVTGVEISDADIKAQYDAHTADYVRPESREIEQIVFPSQDAAAAAAARIKAGTDFAAIAHGLGKKDADVKLGAKTVADLDPVLAKAVFAIPEGGVTQPVKGPFGWVLLRAAKVMPGETKSLDEVGDAIKADLVKARSAAKVTDLVNAFEDARGAGAGLAEAATKVGIPVHHLAAADHMGLTPEGAKTDIPTAPKFLDEVFMTESGEESETFQSEDGLNYAVKVTGVTAPAVKPLASVRENVRSGFMKEARAKLLVTKTAMLAEAARKEGNLAGVGKSVGHAPLTSMPMLRNKTDDVFSAALLQQLFATLQGTVATGPAAKGDGYVIARVVKVDHPQPDINGADYANFRKSAAEQLDRTTIDAMVAAARTKAGVNVHQATLSQVLGETAQQ